LTRSKPRGKGGKGGKGGGGGAEAGTWAQVQAVLAQLFTRSVVVILRVANASTSLRRLLMAQFAHAVSRAYDETLAAATSADIVAVVLEGCSSQVVKGKWDESDFEHAVTQLA
jgi:hypothetical protein